MKLFSLTLSYHTYVGGYDVFTNIYYYNINNINYYWMILLTNDMKCST
jgi:hypothetical protein